MSELLRPIERRILVLHRQGVDHEVIAARFRKSAEFVDRILQWAAIPRPQPLIQRTGYTARERRVLAMRADGLSHEEIGRRFARGPMYAGRIEHLAQMRAASGLA